MLRSLQGPLLFSAKLPIFLMKLWIPGSVGWIISSRSLPKSIQIKRCLLLHMMGSTLLKVMPLCDIWLELSMLRSSGIQGRISKELPKLTSIWIITILVPGDSAICYSGHPWDQPWDSSLQRHSTRKKQQNRSKEP